MAKKVIGILGGISPESTGAYYDRLVKSYYERFRNYYYPRIIIYSLDFQTFTDLENSGDIHFPTSPFIVSIKLSLGFTIPNAR